MVVTTTEGADVVIPVCEIEKPQELLLDVLLRSTTMSVPANPALTGGPLVEPV